MEKVLKLYTYIDGVNDTPFPSSENQIEIFDFTYDAKRMGGAPSISCSLMYKDCLDEVWTEQVYAEFNGEKYFLKQTPTSSYSNKDSRYKHEIELVSERIILDNVYFYDVVSENVNDYKPVTNSDKFTFHGNIEEFVSRLNTSLKQSGIEYSVVIDDDITPEEKLVSFEKSFFSNVLQEIYNTYEIPYYFVGKTIHVGYFQNSIDQIFEYGVDNALLSISKSNNNNKIINRITGVGSSENIPYYYPNDSEKGGITAIASDNNTTLKTEDIIVYDSALYGKKIDLTVDKNNIQKGSILTLKNSDGIITYDKMFAGGNNLWIPAGQELYVDMYDYQPKFIYTKVDFKITQSGDFGLRPSINVDGELLTARDEVIAEYHFNGGEDYTQLGVEDDYFLIRNAPIGEHYVVFRYTIYYNNKQFHNVFMRKTEIATPRFGWYCGNKRYELDELGIEIKSIPTNGDSFYQFRTAEYIEPQTSLMPPIYREYSGAKRFYDAENEKYKNPENGEYYHFNNPYVFGKPKEHIENFEDIKPTIKGMTVDGYRIDMFSEFAYDLNDNDEKVESEDGSQLEYKHPYFFGKLRKLGFNLFNSAIESGEMTISMTSGNCGACKFVIGVDSDTQKNIVQVDENGNLLRDESGDVRCGREGKPSEEPQAKQNDTVNNEVWIALRKDIETFSTIMPNVASKPKTEDTFVILNILLPKSYILAAEKRLEEELIKYMSENNDEKFSFSVDFSRIYLEENKDVLSNLNENSRITIKYNDATYQLYISSYSYKMSANQPLPEIKVDLSEELNVSQNALQNAISQVKADIMGSVGSLDLLQTSMEHFVRKDIDDNVRGVLRYNKGLEVGKYSKGAFGSGGSFYADAEGNSRIEADYITIRKKAIFNDITIQELKHIGGQLILSPAAMLCSRVEDREDGYYCYFDTKNDDGIEIYNEFIVGDQARCQSFNTIEDNRYYWRIVTEIGANYIVLSKDDCDKGSDMPQAGDTIVQLGHRTIVERQNAQILSSFGEGSPYYKQYVGINSFSLEGKEETRISPNDNLFTGRVNIQPNSNGAGNFKDLPEEVQKSAKIGGDNILRNSGFVGNYESEELSAEKSLSNESELYSSSIDFWSGSYNVIEETKSKSGRGVEIIELLSQNVNLIIGENYVVSFFFKGVDSLFSCGGYSDKVSATTEYSKQVIRFTAQVEKTSFEIRGNATLYDIKLERGTIATDWSTSMFDNDKVADEFKHLQYISQAMQNGNTDIIGGLILSSMLQVGKYKDNILESVTAGVNGGYYNDNSVAFWAGGTLRQAINTIAKFSQGQQPTEDDWKNMANFVATHGGDVFMRGYLNALGVSLRGKIETAVDGNKLVIDPDNHLIAAYNVNQKKIFEIDYENSKITLKGDDCSGLSCVLREITLSGAGLGFGENTAFYGALVMRVGSSDIKDATIETATITNANIKKYKLPYITFDGNTKNWKLYVDENGFVKAVN